MIKTILFDADGVVINGKSFSRELEKEHGISMTQTTPFFLNEFAPCLIGQADLKEKIKPFIAEWGWQGTVDDLLQYWFQTEHSLDEELLDYVQGLRAQGIKCFIATNQEKYRAQYMRDQMGFAQHFDGLYASAHLGYKKPDLAFFDAFLQKIDNPAKNEVLFWDDAGSNVKAAKKFGIQAEFYTTLEDFKEKMKSYLLYFASVL